MSIHWKLKTLASSKGIYRAKDLQRLITEKTGVIISLQNICNLLQRKPASIKLKTIEIICTALDCRMKDFCTVSSGKFETENVRKLSFRNTPHKDRGKSKFPDPQDYR